MPSPIFNGMADGNEPVTEVFRFPTDVISSENGTEQRIPLREDPIRVVTFRGVEIDEPEGAMAYAVIDAAEDSLIRIPFWPEQVQLPEDIAAGVTVLDIDVSERRFYPGAMLMLWASETVNEVVEIESIDPGGPTVTLAAATVLAYPAFAYVMPVIEGVLPDSVTYNRAGQVATELGSVTIEDHSGVPVVEEEP